MKKIITSVAVATLLIFCLSACKKSSDTQTPQTTLQKIQAKWQLENYYENDHYSGADHIKNTVGTSGDYLDFRSDGKVYTSLFGYKDTVTYSLITDTQLLIDGVSKYDIKTLTTNSFVIYGKDVSGSDFLEEKITMKK